VATPIGAVPASVAEALAATSDAIVTDAASVKSRVIGDVRGSAPVERMARFVPGHPMGGSERAGPEHASASVVDGIVLSPRAGAGNGPGGDRRRPRVDGSAGRPARRDGPERHDRLVRWSAIRRSPPRP
jgi:prephenate dehydrogenase